jgi:hypothetical protein
MARQIRIVRTEAPAQAYEDTHAIDDNLGYLVNYFRNRTDLLQQVAQRIHELARPPENRLRQLAGVPPPTSGSSSCCRPRDAGSWTTATCTWRC